MPGDLLERYQAFFRSHELDGTSTRAPAVDPATPRVYAAQIITHTLAVERLGGLQPQQLKYLGAIRDAATHILSHVLTSEGVIPHAVRRNAALRNC